MKRIIFIYLTHLVTRYLKYLSKYQIHQPLIGLGTQMQIFTWISQVVSFAKARQWKPSETSAHCEHCLQGKILFDHRGQHMFEQEHHSFGVYFSFEKLDEYALFKLKMIKKNAFFFSIQNTKLNNYQWAYCISHQSYSLPCHVFCSDCSTNSWNIN